MTGEIFQISGARSGVPSLRQKTDSTRVLPLELSPLIAEGAIMEPLAINRNWTARSNQIYGDCSDIVLPQGQAVKDSLFMPQPVMDGARDYMSYECHDLRVVTSNEDGSLSLLVAMRVEPKPDESGIETAPINGFLWSIGGRRQIPRSDSPLDGEFDLVHSILLKAKTEAGIEASSVKGLYDLGIGRTEFPSTMKYISKRESTSGEVEQTSRDVRLKFPQRTINRNIVVVIDSDAVIADHTVDHLKFISMEQYSDPRFRAKFCDYEQAFMDAVFEGWAIQRLAQSNS